ncbi:unnamed protein product [Boreogadus saida]
MFSEVSKSPPPKTGAAAGEPGTGTVELFFSGVHAVPSGGRRLFFLGVLLGKGTLLPPTQSLSPGYSWSDTQSGSPFPSSSPLSLSSGCGLTGCRTLLLCGVLPLLLILSCSSRLLPFLRRLLVPSSPPPAYSLYLPPLSSVPSARYPVPSLPPRELSVSNGSC